MEVRALEAVTDALNRSGIRYLAVGGIAVVAHGYERLTVDLDLVVDLAEPNIRRALEVFQSLGYTPRVPVPIMDFATEANRNRWATEKHMVVFTLLHPDRAYPSVDIFTRIPFDFDGELDDASPYIISSTVALPIVKLASLVKMKRDSGRPKDVADLDALGKAHGKDFK